MQFEIQIFITIVGFIITVYGFYNSLRIKNIEQATKINTLETRQQFIMKDLETHNQRLNDHDVQNKALIAFGEQIKTLTDDVKDLKALMQERK